MNSEQAEFVEQVIDEFIEVYGLTRGDAKDEAEIALDCILECIAEGKYPAETARIIAENASGTCWADDLRNNLNL